MKKTVVFYVTDPNDANRVKQTRDENKALCYLKRGYEVVKVETIDFVESSDSLLSITMTSKMKE